MSEADGKTYRVTIAVSGTRSGNVADLVPETASKIEEGVREEEGSIGMAAGSYTVQVHSPDEVSNEMISRHRKHWSPGLA